MKENNKAWIWGVAAVVVVIIIVLAVRSYNKNDVADTTTTTTTGDQSAITPTEDISTGSANLPKTTGTAAVTMSYQNALTTYATSRIQFDGTCQATPNAATWKTGTKIMLDNRAPVARTIHLGSLGSVTVKGYGFKIVNLSLTGITTNAIAVDCDAHQNVAIITVQK
jgi:hypothetical protein